MISPERLDELEAISRAATKKWKDAGDWYHDHNVGVTLSEEDADHIAEFSPATTLSLLSDLKRAREALGVAKWALEKVSGACEHAEVDYNELCECSTSMMLGAESALTRIEEILNG